jgi:hypothetical protein
MNDDELYLEGSDRGLIEVLSRHLPAGAEKIHETS